MSKARSEEAHGAACSILVATLAATLFVAAPAGAITFGTVDTTNRA